MVHHQVGLFFFTCLTRLNRTAGGSRLKERATSHRWLPDSWVNRKEIFPCLTWPKPSTDLPLLSFSVHMAEHWYRTSIGKAKDFSEASCDEPVVTPPYPATVSSVSRMPGLWAHSSEESPFGSVSINRSEWMRSRQSTETQQHSWVQVPDRGTFQQLSAFSILLQLLARLEHNFQLSTRKKETREWIL